LQERLGQLLFEDRNQENDQRAENFLTVPADTKLEVIVRTGWVAYLKHWTGMDRAIAFTIIARFWSAVAGLLTILLIARFLSPSEQGYYYTFYSLVAVQIIFELGFSFVVLQLAAHERANLSFLPDGRLEGDTISHSRLASVLQKSVRWYSVAAVLMALVVLPNGLHFFLSNRPHGMDVAWKLPWILVVLAAALTFQIDPVFSFLEGCGFVSQVAHMRLRQAVFGSVLAWTAMLTRHGLFSPALMIIGQAAVGLSFLLTSPRRQMLVALLRYKVGPHFVAWRKEIWPFQWRIAISYLSSYFIFQLFAPVLFAYQGPIWAGRMGMSLNIVSAIGAIALAWMSTKASPFGSMVARAEFTQLDSVFFRTFFQSTTLLVACSVTFLVALLVASHNFPKLAMRMMPPWSLGLLLLTAVMNHLIFCWSFYLRAHKREPYLPLSVALASCVCVATILLGRLVGANAVVVGYCVCTGVLGLPWAAYIFVTKRREWHAVHVNESLVAEKGEECD
jgi:hypothetical protein